MMTIVEKDVTWGDLEEDDGSNQEEEKTIGGIVCRTCVKIGDHWTFECPYKDLTAQPEGFVDKPEASGPHLEKGFVLICRNCGKKDDHWTQRCPYKNLAPQPQGFVDKPPTTDGAAAPEMRRMNEENSVRVTNLSEETHELDLGT